MSEKRKTVSEKKYRSEKLNAKKNSSPILLALCIFLLLLIILPIATVMWYSGGTEKDDEYGIEKVTVEKKVDTSMEKEKNSTDINLMESKATIKSPAITESQKSISSSDKEDIPINKDVVTEQEIAKEEVAIQEAPIESVQPSDEINPVSSQSTPEYHIVQEGEGLWRIAKNNNLTLEQIKDLNNLTSDVIQVGQSLLVKK